MSRAAALKQIRSALSPGSVLTDPKATKPYETDGLTALREVPWLVALPETEAQVQQVLAGLTDIPPTVQTAGNDDNGTCP